MCPRKRFGVFVREKESCCEALSLEGEDWVSGHDRSIILLLVQTLAPYPAYPKPAAGASAVSTHTLFVVVYASSASKPEERP